MTADLTLLAGDDEKCLSALRDIAETLERLMLSGHFDSPSLSGACGSALFFEYLSRSGLLPQYDGNASSCLDRALGLIEQGLSTCDLYTGVFGVIWTLGHLRRLGASYAASIDTGDLSDTLIAFLMDGYDPRQRELDLLYGVVGLLVAAIEDPNRDIASRRLIGLAADRILDAATADDDGLYWLSHSREAQIAFPTSYVSLGVSHGVPGAVAALAAAGHFGHERAAAGANSAFRWLRARDSNAPDGHFAKIHDFTPRRFLATSAWCYGDPGVSCALFAAGTYLRDRQMLAFSERVARTAARRGLAESDIGDASLCHGSLGLAHMFRRWFEWSQDELFADVARIWYRETFNLRKEGMGLAGFQPRGAGQDAEAGLLIGIPGIGLALLTALTGIRPEWDRVLLMSPLTV